MKYSKEFKEEAIKLSDELGVKTACAQLGIAYYTLADWRKDRKEEQNHVPLSDVEKRNKELEKEITQLRQANEILKDALGFFAKDRKK